MPAFLAPLVVPALATGVASVGFLAFGKAANETSDLVGEAARLLLIGASIYTIIQVTRAVVK